MSQESDRRIVTEEKALEILRLSRSTLRRYAREGLLDRVPSPKGSRWMYYLDQVEVLRAGRKKDLLTGYSLQERLNIMTSEINNLRRNQRLIAEAVGLGHLEYHPPDRMLSALYESALLLQGTFRSKRPTMATMENWLSSVTLLTDAEYRRLAGLYQEDDHPWRPFYQVTEELIRAVGMHYDLEIDADMIRYRDRLDLCLDRIRASAHIFLAVADPRSDPKATFASLTQSPLAHNDPALRAMQDLQALGGPSVDANKAITDLHDFAQAEASAGRSLPQP